MARTPRPWFRKSKGRWYVTIEGTQTNLEISDERDEAGAWAALRQLLKTGSVKLAIPAPDVASGGSVSRPTVADAAAAWLAESCATVQPQTVLNYRRHAGQFVKTLGGRTVDEHLTVNDVRESSKRPTWSDSNRRSYLDVATAILYAAKWPHQIKKKPRKVSAGPDCVLTLEQHGRIVDRVTGDFKPYLRVLWDLGSRPQELAGLVDSKVRWDDGIAVLRDHKTAGKTGRMRTLYFTPASIAILREQRERHGPGLLFRDQRGGRFGQQTIAKRMWRASARLGFRCTAYHYRHTFITRMLLKGVTTAQVAELVGTSVQMIARHYGHLENAQGLMREVLLKAAG